MGNFTVFTCNAAVTYNNNNDYIKIIYSKIPGSTLHSSNCASKIPGSALQSTFVLVHERYMQCMFMHLTGCSLPLHTPLMSPLQFMLDGCECIRGHMHDAIQEFVPFDPWIMRRRAVPLRLHKPLVLGNRLFVLLPGLRLVLL
jgi:hypothetical protein